MFAPASLPLSLRLYVCLCNADSLFPAAETALPEYSSCREMRASTGISPGSHQEQQMDEIIQRIGGSPAVDNRFSTHAREKRHQETTK